MFQSLLACLILINYCKCNMVDNDININDILRDELMPTTLLLVSSDSDNKTVDNRYNGTYSYVAALSTMTYHRNMMNEYHCRNYLAKQILDEVKTRAVDRLGKPFSKPKQKNTIDNRVRNHRNQLSDIDYNNYKEWLSRIATLEDVYRQYNNSANQFIDNNITKRLDPGVYEEYEGGDVTGYAIQPPMSPPPVQYTDLVSNYGGFYGYPAPPPITYTQESSETHYVEHDVERHHHGVNIADIFELSLTGLAFLSFGMFVLQVIMCITMNKPVSMQVIDNSGTDSLSIEELRVRRALSDNTINNISKYALKTLNTDKTICLQRLICESNKYSKTLTNVYQFWLPLWNLGIAWKHKNNTIQMLSAAALGLAGVDCNNTYPNIQCFRVNI